jgi:hypothetical protein
MDAGISRNNDSKQTTPKIDNSQYAELLGLSVKEMESIEVVDRYNELVMFHYKFDMNLVSPSLARIRGVVVDTKRSYIVCRGGVFVHSVVADKIVADSEGHAHFTDPVLEVDYDFDLTKTQITEFREPVYFRAFLHDGEFFLCTSKKLNPRAAGSRWYDYSEPFTTLYDRAGGPGRDELYSAAAIQSPYTYDLTLIDRSLNLSSIMAGPDDNYVRSDGVNAMWTLETSPFSLEEIGDVNQAPVDPTTLDRIVPNTPITFNAGEGLVLFDTNSGGDPRYGLGESVFLTQYADDGTIDKILHVKSTPYTYRENLFGGEPNIYLTFVNRMGLSQMTRDEKGVVGISQAMPLVDPYFDRPNPDVMDLVARKGDVLLITKQKLSQLTRAQFERMIWVNFWLCASPYYKYFASKCLDRYRLDVSDLKKWVVSLMALKRRNTGTERSNMRVAAIINQAEKRALETVRLQNNRGRSVDSLTEDNISHLIDQEKSASLYQMIKLMRRETETSSVSITDVNQPGAVVEPTPTTFLSIPAPTQLYFPSLPTPSSPPRQASLPTPSSPPRQASLPTPSSPPRQASLSLPQLTPQSTTVTPPRSIPVISWADLMGTNQVQTPSPSVVGSKRRPRK